MGKSIFFSLGVISCVIFLVQIATALDCLFCRSPDLESDCRTGHRKYKPKVDNCIAPGAKCYALAQVSLNGTAKFHRGCTIYPDFCKTQSDVEFCQTCGSQFCNFWIMDLPPDAEDFLKEELAATLESTSQETVSELSEDFVLTSEAESDVD